MPFLFHRRRLHEWELVGVRRLSRWAFFFVFHTRVYRDLLYKGSYKGSIGLPLGFYKGSVRLL